MLNKEHLTDIKKFINIKASMNKGLSENLLLEFPIVYPEIIQENEKKIIMDMI